MSQTTIRVSTKTRDALEQLKVVPQDPLDAVIGRLIALGKDDEGVMRDSVNVLMRERLRKLHGSLGVDEARTYANSMAQRSGKGSRKRLRSRAGSSRKH